MKEKEVEEMLENLRKIMSCATDSQLETMFWLIAEEHSEQRDQALEIIQNARPDLAKKIARAILTAATS